MQSNEQNCLNLNEAFHRYQTLGVVRNVRPRARVCIQGVSSKLVKALLLVDYHTAYSDPSLASSYAVAATFVMDGVSQRSYQQIVDRAVAKHGRSSQGQSYRAELEALCAAIAHSGAVCIQRDEPILSALSSLPSLPVPNLSEALDTIERSPMYDQRTEIAGLKGVFNHEQINWLVLNTLATGQTTYTEERFDWEKKAGEHPGWLSEKTSKAA